MDGNRPAPIPLILLIATAAMVAAATVFGGSEGFSQSANGKTLFAASAQSFAQACKIAVGQKQTG